MVVAKDLPVHVGEVLAGKYRVTRVLGIGGMGAVLEAEHLVLGQRVAIKIILPALAADREHVQRFLREAKVASTLRSEHVARVLDVGALPGDVPYLVMEFLEGTDLSVLVKGQRRLPAEETAEYVIQACEGLAEAHTRGLVHRDIKPANLFITRRVDGSPLLKVLDFGIAKGEGGGSEGMTTSALTRSSTLLGSPLYMSPEQMRSARNVDMRSDIWALGVVLYKLLTGTVPFEATTFGELCMLVVQEEPRPPIELCPELPPALSAVVLRCLKREPSERYDNVGQLAAALLPFAPARAAALVACATAAFARLTVSSSALPAVGADTKARAGTPSSSMRPSQSGDTSPPRSTPPLTETHGPWGGTNAEASSARRSRRLRVVAGAVVITAALLIGLLWTGRRASEHHVEAAAGSAGALPGLDPTSDRSVATLAAPAPADPRAAAPAASSARAAESVPVPSAKPPGSSRQASAPRSEDKARPVPPSPGAPRAAPAAHPPDFGGRK